jgi:hypothetical protein
LRATVFAGACSERDLLGTHGAFPGCFVHGFAPRLSESYPLGVAAPGRSADPFAEVRISFTFISSLRDLKK